MLERLFEFLKAGEITGRCDHRDNIVYLTTLMHFNAYEMVESWIHSEGQLVEAAQQSLMLATDKVAGAIPEGSMLVSVFVEWEKKF
jgi:hypothetical protein